MSTYTNEHFKKVCLSNDPDIDPYDLVKACVNHYGTNNDNKIVASFFENTVGNFLSIGANNGQDQTYQLLVNGWTGVYCEPDPYACIKLIETTKNFKNQVTILNCAITPSGGVNEFYISVDHSQISSLDKNWLTDHIPNVQMQKIMINSLAFSKVLEMFDYKFDYVQIDAEGFDIQIIQSLDWACIPNCKMICTEAGPAVLKQLCQQGGYMITDRTLTNAFYKQKQFVLAT